MKEIIAYKCDHCGKKYMSKGGCKNHEKKCFFNDVNKACATCEYLYEGLFMKDLRDCDKGVDISETMKTNCPLHKLA